MLLLALPLLTAFIGWATNWLAVRMIFHPRHFVGIGPIGWQGIVHRNSERFAREFASTIRAVVDPAELLERIDARQVAQTLATEAGPQTEELIGQLVDRAAPGTWQALPEGDRSRVVAYTQHEVQRLVAEMQVRAAAHADDLLDIEELAVELLSGPESARLARLSRELGAGELRFIERYGAVFGLFVGVLQMLAHGVLGVWWLLPLIGAIVGAGTNWLAILMIFRPLEPTRYLGVVTYQGLFPRRQAEIARDFAATTAEEILSAEQLLRRLAGSPAAGTLAQVALVTANDGVTQVLELALDRTPSESEVQAATMAALQLPSAVPAEARDTLNRVVQSELDLADLMGSRLATMPKVQFERLLRGMFEQDEATLVAIGGLLGALIGLLQAALLAASA